LVAVSSDGFCTRFAVAEPPAATRLVAVARTAQTPPTVQKTVRQLVHALRRLRRMDRSSA
jgi:hypothetical protein